MSDLENTQAGAVGEEGQLESAVAGLARTGKLTEATQEIIKQQSIPGAPVTFARGDRVIKRYADGREEVLAHIERRKFKRPAGVPDIEAP